MAVEIASDCLRTAVKGGNKLKFTIDFCNIDKDELFTCLRKMDYELTQDANDSNKLIVTW